MSFAQVRVLYLLIGLLASSPSWVRAADPMESTGQAASIPLLLNVPLRGEQTRSAPDVAVDKQVVRSRDVSINPLALVSPTVQGRPLLDPGQNLTLNLFDDVNFTAIPTEVTATARGFNWIGRLDGIEQSQVTLVSSNGVVSANIVMPSARYHIRLVPGGDYQVQQIDTSLFPPDHPTEPPRAPFKLPSSADLVGPVQADSGAQVDVMVLYSGTARAAAGGVAAMGSLVDLAIAETNTAYLNSGITFRVRLVQPIRRGLEELSTTTRRRSTTWGKGGSYEQEHDDCADRCPGAVPVDRGVSSGCRNLG